MKKFSCKKWMLFLMGFSLLTACAHGTRTTETADPLPSWNDMAPKRGWTVVSMKDDWNRVFPLTAP